MPNHTQVCAPSSVLHRCAPPQAALLAGSAPTAAAQSAAMEQMRALAEASLSELQARIGERDGQIAKLQQRLSEQQAEAVGQQQKARQELQALSQRLLDKDAGSLQGLRAALQQVQVQVARTAAGADLQEVPYEQLRAQLEEKAAEVEVLAAQLQQKQAELEVAQETAKMQAQRWAAGCCGWLRA